MMDLIRRSNSKLFKDFQGSMEDFAQVIKDNIEYLKSLENSDNKIKLTTMFIHALQKNSMLISYIDEMSGEMKKVDYEIIWEKKEVQHETIKREWYNLLEPQAN